MLNRFLTPRWLLTTLLVIAAIGVMARLGVWQLDRLAHRRAFNARVQGQQNAPVLDLNSAPSGADLYNMEYRPVTLRGEYDFSHQVMLRNQVWNDQPGVHLLTPIKLAGSAQWVLVDRGWIPFEQAIAGNLSQYDEPGMVTVTGIIRRSQPKPDFGGVPDPTAVPGGAPLQAVNIVSVERIQQQVSGSLLPVFVQQAPPPGEGEAQPPIRSLPVVTLTEGPHLGYAVQWFIFASILGLGYPFFLRKQLAAHDHPGNGQAAGDQPTEDALYDNAPVAGKPGNGHHPATGQE